MKSVKCLNCGTANPASSDYCSFCSAPIEKAPKPVSAAEAGWQVVNKTKSTSDNSSDQKAVSGKEPKPTGLALVAVIAGGLGIFNVCAPFTAAGAIVMGSLVLQNIKNDKEPEKSRRMAKTAIITGVIGLLITIGRWFYFYTNYGVNIFNF